MILKNVTEGNMESKGSLSNNKEEGGGDESDDTASNCSININNEDADILTDEVRASLNEFISRRRKSKLKNLPSVVKEFLAIQKAEELFKDYEMPEILDYTSHIRARACFTP
ncbi:unnamed protein product [Lepeophtheirus salmonis]|uniref:(salmon louse) hypothetical protein n=2 Tax=Lepeophtheirus salmonis TaxID=72036 RepID=A0A7R8CBW0_LEPSM|nr:unnamed protein product [Lepeophtheirus salmonis]CAF2764684.1 unnamed protein product [Lepeophtheirus salmonis]